MAKRRFKSKKENSKRKKVKKYYTMPRGGIKLTI